ncbi:hypothetical protein DBV15_03792 [Temnothorax longispinosus]|uniref:Uncharacterized protein n=1 Tax=Temnothorax longispinosus TaxID=300112 RepID=A0A4S2JDT6_9HYME|nr:hypothetical protein DBV15_03792 [Temnothorax longispinosus]
MGSLISTKRPVATEAETGKMREKENETQLDATAYESRTQWAAVAVRESDASHGATLARSSRASQCASADGDINPLPGLNVRRFLRGLSDGKQ